MSNKTVLQGVRPIALKAVSERERLMAHPHRAQAAVNHARALRIAAAAPDAGVRIGEGHRGGADAFRDLAGGGSEVLPVPENVTVVDESEVETESRQNGSGAALAGVPCPPLRIERCTAGDGKERLKGKRGQKEGRVGR